MLLTFTIALKALLNEATDDSAQEHGGTGGGRMDAATSVETVPGRGLGPASTRGITSDGGSASSTVANAIQSNAKPPPAAAAETNASNVESDLPPLPESPAENVARNQALDAGAAANDPKAKSAEAAAGAAAPTAAPTVDAYGSSVDAGVPNDAANVTRIDRNINPPHIDNSPIQIHIQI